MIVPLTLLWPFGKVRTKPKPRATVVKKALKNGTIGYVAECTCGWTDPLGTFPGPGGASGGARQHEEWHKMTDKDVWSA